MTNEQARAAAIAARPLLSTVIVINAPQADFTPKGKRRARIVKAQSGRTGYPSHIRWYVGTEIYRKLETTPENAKLSNQWLEASR